MAKATTAPQGKGPKGRPPEPRVEQGNYLSQVIQELRKTTWPTSRELVRMTQIVAATVVLFAFLIGGLDLVLSYAVKPIYTQIGTAQPTLAPTLPAVLPPVTRPSPTPTATTTASPTPGATGSSTSSASSSTSTAATAAPSPAASPAPAATATP